MGADRVALWVHGHTHTSVDFEVAGTRVVSNQRDYPGEGEESGFRPALVIDLDVLLPTGDEQLLLGQ